MSENSFHKGEKLKGKLSISLLFQKGQHVSYPPVRIIWLISSSDDNNPLKTAVSVPKRLFNKAVVRNRIKRKLRETYRLNNKDLKRLCKDLNIKLHLMIIYTGKEEKDYHQMEKAMKAALNKIFSNLKNRPLKIDDGRRTTDRGQRTTDDGRQNDRP